MKLRTIIFTAACVLAAACTQTKTVTLVSYNVGVFHKYTDNSMPEVIALVKEAGAGIVGLNELDSMARRTGERDQLREFAGGMGGWEYNYTPAFDFQGGAYGIGTCADPSLNVLGSYDVALGKHDGSEPRMMSVMNLQDFVFATLHIDHVSAGARMEQAKRAEGWLMHHFAESGKPVFLSGDFNDTPESEVISHMAENWTLISDKGNSHSSDKPEICIDYIFLLNNGAECEVIDAHTIAASSVADPAAASDHLAKAVTVKIRAQKPSALNPKPLVIPEVKSWEGGKGSMGPLSGRIVAEGEDASAVAELLAGDLKLMGKGGFSIVSGGSKAGDIVLRTVVDESAGEESYTLRVSDRAELCAPARKGLYWSTRTLLQLLEQGDDLPKGSICDEPEYGLRGFMIDCGRKNIPMDYLRNLVKIMAYYKMNTLQVHLNDCAIPKFTDGNWDRMYSGFRLESETFPGLASKDGSYTKEEFKAFQKEAETLGVEIIPEIDAPAHTLAFAHYKKSLGSREYGLDHLDLFNDECYEFMDALWKEYLEGDDPVFYGPRVHIGTDEYSNKDSLVVEKFRYFTDRYIKYVESFGKQACVWGALTHADGVTPVKSEGVIMSEWYNGYAQPRDMKAAGYDMISIPDGWTYIVPAAGYYYDYLDTRMLYDRWTPAHIGREVFDENDPQILGGMFAEWNDHIGNGISISDIHDRVFPAIQTMSTKCWAGARTIIPFDDFEAARGRFSEAPGVNELGREGFAGRTFAGYGYKVTFTVDAAQEEKGTVLSRCDRSTFYLSDPETGRLGFSRDGYLITFSQSLLPGSHSYTVECTSDCTKLYVDGQLTDSLDLIPAVDRVQFAKVSTLVFPLGKVQGFKSKVSEFKVEKI